MRSLFILPFFLNGHCVHVIGLSTGGVLLAQIELNGIFLREKS